MVSFMSRKPCLDLFLWEPAILSGYRETCIQSFFLASSKSDGSDCFQLREWSMIFYDKLRDISWIQFLSERDSNILVYSLTENTTQLCTFWYFKSSEFSTAAVGTKLQGGEIRYVNIHYMYYFLPSSFLKGKVKGEKSNIKGQSFWFQISSYFSLLGFSCQIFGAFMVAF